MRIILPIVGVMVLAYRVVWRVVVLFAKLIVFIFIQIFSLFVYIISYVFGRIQRKKVNSQIEKGEYR